MLAAPLIVAALAFGGLGLLGFFGEVHDGPGAYCFRLSPIPPSALPPDTNPAEANVELFPLGVSCAFDSRNGVAKVVVPPPWTNTIELLTAAGAASLATFSTVIGVVLVTNARRKVNL